MNNKPSKREALLKVFTPKQLQVFRSTAKILILHGAKRSGKTVVLIYLFMMIIWKNKGRNLKFILGGVTFESIQANVIDTMEEILGRKIKRKGNKLYLFGNQILVRTGSNIDSVSRVRGFEAAGAYLNEGTMLHENFIQECISRCSQEDARLFIDTNPENPTHFIKVNFIDKGQVYDDYGKLYIDNVHFRLYDNTFLSPNYIKMMELATPSGMFRDRDLEGLWVSGEGTIYRDFNSRVHVIDKIPDHEQIYKYKGGIDWGYRHKGALVVLAYAKSGNIYLVEEFTAEGQQPEYWRDIAVDMSRKYFGIEFYCDSARPEHIDLLIMSGVQAFLSDKRIVEGIAYMSTLIRNMKLFFLRNVFVQGLKEITTYSWGRGEGENAIKKINDDIMDAIRYALYSEKEYDDFLPKRNPKLFTVKVAK